MFKKLLEFSKLNLIRYKGPQEYNICPSPIRTWDLGLGPGLNWICDLGIGNWT